MPIHRSLDTGVALLALDLGRGNAIDHTFLDALGAALDSALADGARVVVLTGRGKLFCGGLDLLTLASYDRAGMGRFVDALDRCLCKVLAFPRPVVAAVNGHALAGGAILAFAADHRVAQAGPAQIGLNELTLGLSLPASAFEIACLAASAAARARVLLEGRLFSPEEALRHGLVHEIAPDALAAATAQAKRFTAGEVNVVAEVKADLVAPVLARIQETMRAKRERFLDRWFGAEAQARLAALRTKLARKA
jgi:enoyl-CoA hydratase